MFCVPVSILFATRQRKRMPTYLSTAHQQNTTPKKEPNNALKLSEPTAKGLLNMATQLRAWWRKNDNETFQSAVPRFSIVQKMTCNIYADSDSKMYFQQRNTKRTVPCSEDARTRCPLYSRTSPTRQNPASKSHKRITMKHRITQQYSKRSAYG